MRTLPEMFRRPLRSPVLVALALLAVGLPRLANADSYRHDDPEDFGWSLIGDEDRTISSATDRDDWAEIRELRDEATRPLFWFRLDGKSYVVRDAETIARVSRITEPMRELGRRQSELGHRQSELGSRQSELGSRQSKLGGRQAALSGRLSRLSYSSWHERDRETARERRRLQDEIESLSDEQRDLGRRQAELGAQQAKLGREQGAMGREQALLSHEAEPELRRIADQAIRDARAEPLSH